MVWVVGGQRGSPGMWREGTPFTCVAVATETAALPGWWAGRKQPLAAGQPGAGTAAVTCD